MANPEFGVSHQESQVNACSVRFNHMKMCQVLPGLVWNKSRISSSFVIVFVSGRSIAFVLVQSIGLVSETLIHCVGVAELGLLKAVREV